ncbi:C6 finger domain protein, putative [Rhizoctonia solani AG-1 IB]|uniref:C6 finger domain protein, putative n=1 Tax=Thanatephorus cucumeris (strain AG1-IB / isolate 7/3/14) TaxID=1108050 RepID=A0A0B7FI81_THACB|nr:C6 finger domain protein, putative [Rhizoctonia solani AG-1 IB]
MFTQIKVTPGPTSVRCLTCKHRHKKCDQGRPACDRCSQGGYKCLGYERNNSNAYGHSYDGHLPSDHPNSSTSGSGYRLPGSSTPSLSPRSEDGTRSDESLTTNVTTTSKIRTTDSNLKAGALIQPGTAHARQDLSDVFGFSDRDAVVYDTFPPTRPKVAPALHSAGSQPPVFPTNPLLFDISSRMLKGVPMTPEVHGVMECVISHYAKIHDSVIEGNHSMYTYGFTRWIDGFENAVRKRLEEALAGYEFQDRINDVLEMLLVKSRYLGTAATYSLFCRFVPSFLQIVYSDPALCPPQHDPTLVSMAHILAGPRCGPVSYMMIDVMSSMVYGLPQLVDYNTHIEFFHPELHPVERFGCFPGEFVVLLAKINACRDQTSTEGWQSIERQLVSWESRPQSVPRGLESWKLVAWLALQETWRHTLLIYLYLSSLRLAPLITPHSNKTVACRGLRPTTRQENARATSDVAGVCVILNTRDLQNACLRAGA